MVSSEGDHSTAYHTNSSTPSKDSWHENGESSATLQTFRRPRTRADNIATEYSRKEPRRRSSDHNDILEEFTVNKLQFSSMDLYGREEQTKALEDALDQVCKATTLPDIPIDCEALQDNKYDTPTSLSRQLVLIAGYSGTGKTALAKTLEIPVRRKRGILACGKFDDTIRNEPYSGIAAACQELCGIILAFSHLGDGAGSNEGSITKRIPHFQDELIATLGDELPLLSRIIPGLVEIVRKHTGNCSIFSHHQDYNATPPAKQDQEQGHQSLKAYKQRFQYVFLRFFRLIAKFFAPLVILLDDLQWADTSSIELVEYLLADHQISGLLIVGCYRSNEIEETHIFMKSLNSMRCQHVNQRGYGLVEIAVDCLTVDQINQLLMDLLLTDEPNTLDLAKICHRKTLGNPFFLIHFIAMLEAKKLLEYNFGLLKWRWDLTEIENQTVATDNVVDLMKHKIGKLPPDTQHCVQLVSCLGFVVAYETLKLVWKEYQHDGESSFTEENLISSLDNAVEEGVLERSRNSGEFRWVHDKIKEAALATLTPVKLRHMRHQIGRILVDHFSYEELESAIFVVVDLLNDGMDSPSEKLVTSVAAELVGVDVDCSTSSTNERMHLAGLNLRAAENAVKLSAFESAAKYANRGISLLGNDGWDLSYDLSLQLYSIAAETEGYLGNFKDKNRCCDEVLEHAVSFDDKLRVYHAQFDSMMVSAPSELVGFCLAILKKMGCTFPRSKVVIRARTIAGLMRTKKQARMVNFKQDSFKLLDPRKVETMRMLDKLFSACFHEQNPLSPLVVLRLLEVTKENGLCGISAVAYGLVGIILAGTLMDFEAGAAYGNYALSVLKQTKSMLQAPRVNVVVYGGIFPLCKPVHTVLRPLVDCYEHGTKIGDTLNALTAIGGYIIISFQCGTPLKAIAEDCQTYVPQMELLRKAVRRFLAMWQVAQNLMGLADDPEELFGEILTGDHFNTATPEEQTRIQICQVLLLAHLGEYTRGADIAISLISKIERSCARPMLVMKPYFTGLCYFVAARLTKKRIYRKHARKCLATIKSFVKKGNPNARHWEALLDAENEALKGNRNLAVKHYERAIFLASRFGFIHDAAKANLRLGEYMTSVLGNPEEGLIRIKKAIELYKEWGAQAIVDRIHRQYPQVVPK